MNKESKILLTGASGFLGAYILRLLLKESYNNITCLKRASSNMGLVQDIQSKVDWLEADILDAASVDAAVESADVVIHTAAIISLDPNKRQLMYRTNVDGTSNVVNAALEHNIEKLIHISSIAAIGRNKNGKVISEETEWEDNEENSHYAISKLNSELEVWRGAAEGLKMAIINPSLILGAGHWDNGTAGITKRIAKGIPFYPTGSNGFCDVRDVAIAVVKLMESSIINERFIISNKNMTYKEAFTAFAESLNVKMTTKPFKKWLGAIAWRVEWVRAKLTGAEMLVTRESIKTTASNSNYNNQKSIDLLGMEYRDMHKSIAEISALFLQSNTDYGLLDF